MAYAEPVDGIMASILALEAYDTTYGLHPHDIEHAPLSLIEFHPKENHLQNGTLQMTIRAFRKHRVGTHMNMSLIDFLNCPRHVTKMILKDCEQAEEEEGRRAKAVADALNAPPGK